MDIELGIANVARPVTFSTEEDAASVTEAIESALQPRGVAVLIEAEHQCMTTRGVNHRHVSTVTNRFTGAFKDDPRMADRFLNLARQA